MTKTLLREQFDLANISLIAKRCANELNARGAFVAFLEGELGAGKTTLTAEILRSLGLPANEPVLSPTFTYINDYEIGDNWFAHFDLYRLPDGTDIEDLGILELRDYLGIFIEWPQRLSSESDLTPSHIFRISRLQQTDLRLLEVEER